MIPEVTVYDESPDGTQLLLLTPLGTVAWDSETGDVWDAEYNADEAVWADIIERLS